MNAEERCRDWSYSWFGFFSYGYRTDPPAPPQYLNLPRVVDFIDREWRYPDVIRLTDYLNQHLKVFALELEQSKCLLCEDMHSPSHFHWDGAWLWPASLSHYVAVHGVRLPDRMLCDLEARDFNSRGDIRPTPLESLPWPPVVESSAWLRFKLWAAKTARRQ